MQPHVGIRSQSCRQALWQVAIGIVARGLSGGLILCAAPAFAQTVTYTYDSPGTVKSVGRLSTISDPSSQTSITIEEYDIRGHVKRSVKSIMGNTYPMETTYDSLGRLKTLKYPDNEIVTHTYDPGGRLDTVGSYVTDTTYTYTAGGHLQSTAMTLGNGIVTTYTYDPNHFLINQLKSAYGTTDFQKMDYTYDGVGNVKTVVDSVTAGENQTFGYDQRNRLASATGPYGSYTYGYDQIGNITCNSTVPKLTGAALPTCVGADPNYSYPASGATAAQPHAVTGAGTNRYTYDANGNLLSGAGRTLQYDIYDRPTQVTSPTGTATFVYDYSGSRVKKTAGGTTITYVNSFWECSQSGVCSKYIYAGGARVAVKTGTDLHYFHGDHLGSSVLVTSPTRVIERQMAYEPYGKLRQISGSLETRYKYTGQELDETGLYDYHARLYDPILGRFNQPDTATSEHYSYARNNPIIYTDPTGQMTADPRLVGHGAGGQFGIGWSNTYNTPLMSNGNTAFPSPALMGSPGMGVPGGMNLGSMGSHTLQYNSLSGSIVNPAQTFENGLLRAGTVIDISTTSASQMSGNALWAQVVYSQGQYASIFSALDIAEMTWDRGRFWDLPATEISPRFIVGTWVDPLPAPPPIPNPGPPPGAGPLACDDFCQQVLSLPSWCDIGCLGSGAGSLGMGFGGHDFSAGTGGSWSDWGSGAPSQEARFGPRITPVPRPPGYRSNWSRYRNEFTDPKSGTRWRYHPEDDGHFEHWDKYVPGKPKDRVPIREDGQIFKFN